MDHLAIMKKEWNLVEKILSGEKTIETRWYKNRIAPWGKISIGDKIYFKDSGNPVCLTAEVSDFKEIEIQSKTQAEKIIQEIWKEDICNKNLIKNLQDYAFGKRFCILIYLKNPKKIDSFDINKKGFGMQSAWISLDSIERIKRN